MLLYYIRHGEPTYDPDELTPNGRRQAEAIARRLARYGVDKIYSSSSIRAQQTARPTAELTRCEVVTLDWCHEDYAKAEMMLPSNGDPTGNSPSGGGKRRWCFYIPEIVTMMIRSFAIFGASSMAFETACADSMAGIIPSVLERYSNACTASSSVTGTYSALPMS